MSIEFGDFVKLDLDQHEEREVDGQMMTSVTRSFARDSYIQAQAFYEAIKIMESRTNPEYSNIQDMKRMAEYCSPSQEVLAHLFDVNQMARREWLNKIERDVLEGN